MDLISIKETLEDRFTIFHNEESVKRWIKDIGYTWITKNNKEFVTEQIQEYVILETQNRLEILQRDIEEIMLDSFENDLKIHSFIEETSDSWGMIIGGGGVALLTLLIEGAVFWPLTIVSAIGGFFIGREKMTSDFAKSVYNSSKSICYNLCEKITAVIDDLINKAKYKEMENSLANTTNSTDSRCENETFYVNNTTYGKGYVISIIGDRIEINFNNLIKNFIFPDAFMVNHGRCFLDIVDDYDNVISAIKYLESHDLLSRFPDIKLLEFSINNNASFLQESIDKKTRKW